MISASSTRALRANYARFLARNATTSARPMQPTMGAPKKGRLTPPISISLRGTNRTASRPAHAHDSSYRTVNRGEQGTIRGKGACISELRSCSFAKPNPLRALSLSAHRLYLPYRRTSLSRRGQHETPQPSSLTKWSRSSRLYRSSSRLWPWARGP